MNTRQRTVALSALTLLAAACSGNLGSGATPPLTAPQGGAPVAPAAAAAAPVPAAALPGSPLALDNHSTITVRDLGVSTLPSAGGFAANICIISKIFSESTCVAASPSPKPSAAATLVMTSSKHALALGTAQGAGGSPAPSASPAASASPNSSASPAPSGSPSSAATPAPSSTAASRTTQSSASLKRHHAFSMDVALHAFPTDAPPRADGAPDGATAPLLKIELTPTEDATLNGFSAFTLTLPIEQAVSTHNFAIALFDVDAHGSRGGLGNIGASKHRALTPMAMTTSGTLSDTTLRFADTTPMSLRGKHHYLAVLYTDEVEATPTPLAAALPPVPLPTGSGAPPNPPGGAVPATVPSPGASGAAGASAVTSGASPLAASPSPVATTYSTFPSSSGAALPAATPSYLTH